LLERPEKLKRNYYNMSDSNAIVSPVTVKPTITATAASSQSCGCASAPAGATAAAAAKPATAPVNPKSSRRNQLRKQH
jgi:hypothetical protein